MQGAGRNTLGVSDVVKTLTIQCEAADCRALLQVGVPSSHASNPVIIVKCGNCSRLLEVRLDAGQQGTAQRPGSSSQGGSGSRAAASQALEWGPSDAMEGPRGSSGGLGGPQHSQQRVDPKEDASRIIEDILTRNTEEEGPRGGPASGRRGDHHPGFGRAAYSAAPMFSQQPMSRAQPQHSRGLPEMQAPRGGREQYLGTEGFPGSPPHRAPAQQQLDSFGRYQHRYHEQPQQQQQQQQQVHAHGHGMAAHARSPEGPSPGARAAALALGPAAGLRLQSPEGLLAHAHMSTLDSPPRLSYAGSADHQYQQQHPQQSQRMLFQQPQQQQQSRQSYSQFEAGRYLLPPDELPPRSRPDAREMAAQSPPEDIWARAPGRPGGQMSGQPSGQPGSFRGFDFTSERSMLHAQELTAAHTESGGRKRPAEQEGIGGSGGRGGTRGPLLDPKAVLGGQGWKLQRVRSLGSLPSDEALLAQAARWPDRRSRPHQDTVAPQHKPEDEATKNAHAEATALQSHTAVTQGLTASTPTPVVQHQTIPTGQERSAQPADLEDAQQPPSAAAAVPARAPIQDPPSATAGADPPASTAADPPAARSGGAGDPGLHPLRIEPLNLDAAAGEAEPYSNLSSSHIQAGGNQDGSGVAGNAASPLSHGSLNAFNPFEGGSEFTLSPLRRGGDNRGDCAGGQGSPAAHSGYSPFGLVSDLGFTPDH